MQQKASVVAFLISTTEHDIAALGCGIQSALPEEYGVDILIFSPRGLCGIQRKSFPEDLFSSLNDGRLARELLLMNALEWPVLVPEGRPRFDNGGHLLSEGNSRWTQQAIRNLLRSVKLQHGVDVEWSESLSDTIAIAHEWEQYLKKGVHRSLLTRPKSRQSQGEWGEFNQRDWARFFLQGLPGVGSVLAESIADFCIKRYGKAVPLSLDCALDELMQIPGIGKKRARMFYDLFTAAEER